MRLREHTPIVVELDGVRERNVTAVHPHRSRDRRPEVGLDRAPQRVVHPVQGTRVAGLERPR